MLPEIPGVGRVRRRLQQVARQHPLLETRPSIEAVRHAPEQLPRAVFAGVGLVSGGTVTQAVPLDVLGLLLGAEEVRRATDADELVVLVADAHALGQGAPAAEVEPRAAHYARVLRRVAERCGLDRMRLLRATDVHRDPAYERILHRVSSCTPSDADPYLELELADIAHFVEEHGSLVKVGWALQPAREGADRDERAFDECYRRWLGHGAWFVYTKAGRTLDDRRRKAPPYVELDASRRVCLSPDEDVAGKLASCDGRASYSTRRGVRNHLSRITRTYAKLVRPLGGSLEERVQAMIDDVVGGQPLGDDRPEPLPVLDATA